MRPLLSYIDPGTGSLLISLLAGIALSLLYSIRGIYYKISSLTGRNLGGKTSLDFPGQLVFFSEGQTYWRVYQTVLAELIKRKQHFVYLSADKDDKGLRLQSEYAETHYIGGIKQAIVRINKLKAKLCIMTTPQLDVISLKRSKQVDHYCHIVHSPTDVHAYKLFAFDYFDSVLCSSPFQIESLRSLETRREGRRKKLFETGCSYYDVFPVASQKAGEAILVAPTWGDRTFFKTSGIEILAGLLHGGHQVIFRPHPQSWISDKQLMQDVCNQFGEREKFTIDRKVGGEDAIRDSKLMICDITSGMVYDMALAYKKPVVAIQSDWKNGGYESSNIPGPTTAIKLLKEVGAIVPAEKIGDIASIVDIVSSKKVTEEIINRHIFNFQKTGPVAAQQILQLLNQGKNDAR